jgi:hypothetical protein
MVWYFFHYFFSYFRNEHDKQHSLKRYQKIITTRKIGTDVIENKLIFNEMMMRSTLG